MKALSSIFSKTLVFSFTCVLVSSCNNIEPNSQRFVELFPIWQVQFDSATRRITAVGSIASSRSGLFEKQGDVRLTGGDRLEITSNDNRWLLFRRKSEFVYRRSFILPLDTNQTELEFNTTENRIPPNIISVNNEVLPISQLSQESLTLITSTALDVSWQLPTETPIPGSALSTQQVLVTLQSCGEGVVEEQIERQIVPLGTNQTRINTDFQQSRQPESAASCNYHVQVLLTYSLTDNAQIEYTVRSRQMPFSLVF